MKAVFLDRDGTLIRGYNGRPANTVEEVSLLPGVLEGVSALKAAGFQLVVVTNQGGIGLGFTTTATVMAQHRKIDELLVAGDSTSLDAYYFCGHHPKAGCSCRKPEPGMINQACCDIGIDVSASFLIGDSDTDIMAGKAAGTFANVLTISDRFGQNESKDSGADLVANNFYEAAKNVVAMDLRKTA